MDRALPAEVIRKARIKKYSVIAAVLLLLLVGFSCLRAIISPTLERDKIRTSIAELGTVEATITASGVVVPEFEQVLTSPVASTVEKTFLRSGDSVKAGESILQLNKELLMLSFQKLTDELEIQKNKKQQLILDLQRKKINLQASYDIKELQIQFAQSKYDRVKRLHDIGGASDEEFDIASLDVEIAQRELQQLAKQIENQEESMAADLKELDLQIRVGENKVREIQRELDLADARAGQDGIITWLNDNIGSPVNPGDVIARVADLSSFKVESSISDIHADKLIVGGPVKVRIGERNLQGQIGSVRPAVKDGIVTFIVELDQKANQSLRPSLRTDVYVITSCTDNVVRVKNGPFYTGLVDQEVFIIKGDMAVRKIVDIGVSNYDYVELQGDIAPGDEVIISDMRDYRHMDEVDIRKAN